MTTKAESELRALFLPQGRADRSGLVVEDAVLDPDGRRLLRRARIQTTVERMMARNQISARQSEAAVRLYRDYAVGVCGAAQPAPGSTQAPDPTAFTDTRLDALERYRRAVHHLGIRLSPIIERIVIEDQSLETVARETGAGRGSLSEVLRIALSMVADSYHLPEEDQT